MINPNVKKIYIVDSDGNREDETDSIAEIHYVESKQQYVIIYKNNLQKKYTYPEARVEFVEDCLTNEDCKSVYDYLSKIAGYSELKSLKGESLLAKQFPEENFINSKSVLKEYLNPTMESVKKNLPKSLIFPFGCNNSQYKAIKNAIENSISIIQGPPGTGKTQTILNIIANLLIQQKTVLVVSNNNDAIKNVQDKLSSTKYGLDFICACLGKKENVDEFILNQTSTYPKYLEEWGLQQKIDISELQEEIEELKDFFNAQESISKKKLEIEEIQLEKKHFDDENKINLKTNINRLSEYSSSQIMDLWLFIQDKFSKQENLSIFFKFILFVKYGIGSFKFWTTECDSVITFIKKSFYEKRIIELKNDIKKDEELLLNFKPEVIYNKSLNFLHKSIYKKYSKNKKKVFSDTKEIGKCFSSFLNEYPVVFSTTFSSRNCLPYKKVNYLYDYLIMDESSQVDIASGALALSCAKNCVIVGDKMQLPNVVDEKVKVITDKILQTADISKGYSFSLSFLESMENVIPNIPQTLLKEHYRCHPKIINFCNKYFYNNELIIMTEDKGEKNVINAIKTVPGNHCSGNYNQRQIDIVKDEILPSIANDKLQYENIGIVTPYNDQVKSFQNQLSQIESATVHKFQGREKDVIIISTVDNVIKSFTDNPNLLNVAISRAKKNLYIIVSGNEQPKNSNIMNFISYIEYMNCSVTQSKINSVYDYLYKQYSRERFIYLRNKKKISKFDSENITYNLLLEILGEQEFSQYEVVFEYPFKNILNKNSITLLSEDEKNYAKNDFSHIDFALFNKLDKKIIGAIEVDGYRFHKKGTKQSIRDAKKNHILELLSIPYLRLSTKDSSIKEKIIKWLKQLMNT